MKGRVRLAAVVVVILVAGAFIGSAVSQWLSLPAGSEAAGAGTPAVEGRIRVEVLNAGGVAGRAGEATEVLRDTGFDVVFFGNAGSFDHDSSVVLDRVGEVDPARAVADVLGIRNVRSEPDSNLYLDVTVLVGRDWVPAVEDAGLDQAAPRPWWDPRGWFGR